jgi:O-antigen/teichoic acid export membrane protein
MNKITAVLAPGKRLVALMKQSLFTNAGYLLGINVVASLVGFVFWSLATRLYETEDVGTASAVISAVTLVSGIASLGVSMGIVRLLPKAQFPVRFLNTAFTFNTMMAILASGIFLTGISLWAPSLMILQENAIYAAGFIVYTSATTLGAVIQMAFLARKQAVYALIQASIVNGSRLILVPILVGLGAAGLVGSVMLAIVMAVLLSLAVFLPKVETSYRLRPSLSWSDLTTTVPYSLGNYIAVLLNQTSAAILPLIVLELIGPEASGYTYIVWMLGSLLSSPGIALANSAFAEGSNSPHNLSSILTRAAAPGLLLTTSLATTVGVTAPWILLLFGPEYAREASSLLRTMAVAAPMVFLRWLYFTRLRVQKLIGRLILASSIVALCTLALAILLTPSLGISATGIGWLIGNSLIVLIALVEIWKEKTDSRKTRIMTPWKPPHLPEKPLIVAAIPCYNEAHFIADVVRRTQRHVDIVVVVDDCSTDNTTEVAQAAGARVIRHATNMGPGAAARSCLQAGRDLNTDILVTLDGDGQHNPDEIPVVIAPILDSEADLVIGSRFLGRYNNVAAYRRFGIDVITFLYNVGSQAKITDGQSCFRAHNRRTLETLQITEPGFGFSVETLVQARNAGLHIREASISCVYHEESHSMNPVLHGVGVALMVVKHRIGILLGSPIKVKNN